MLDVILLVFVIAFLIFSIVKIGIHPFIALLISGVMLGLFAGMPVISIMDTLQDGFAGTLRWIGIVMVLGTLVGEILFETGGSFRIADTVLKIVGKKRIPLTMGITGYIVAIPVFVDVAYIMLQPVTESLAVKSKRNILVVGLSLTAGLTATHALIPPTPGPLAAAGLINADLGRLILINAFVAFCATAGGLFWATFYCKREVLPYDRELADGFKQKESILTQQKMPGALGAFTPILLPLILIALRSFIKSDINGFVKQTFQFLGSPTIALLIGVFCASLLLKKGQRTKKIHELLDRAIQKAAIVIMITGAGGAFGGVIKASPIGHSVSDVIANSGIPGFFFPFLLAAAITTSTGSLTVSMVTSSTIVASVIGSLNLSPEMAIALIGAGSFCVFHANTSFFWLLSRLHKVPPNVLFRTFTAQSLFMGLSGFLGVVLLRLLGVH